MRRGADIGVRPPGARVLPIVALCLAASMLLLGLVAPPAAAVELLMFEKPGCPWCALWDREVGPGYPRTSEGRRAPLRRLALRARPAGIALALPVTHSPTFVLVDRGREVGRITGYPGVDFFWGLLAGMVERLPPDGADPPQAGTATR